MQRGTSSRAIPGERVARQGQGAPVREGHPGTAQDHRNTEPLGQTQGSQQRDRPDSSVRMQFEVWESRGKTGQGIVG